MADDAAPAATAPGDAPSSDTAPAVTARPGEADRSAEDLLADAVTTTDAAVAAGDDIAAQLAAEKAEKERWQKFARKHEDEVKKLRPAAQELQQIKDASKTEAERLTERAAQAEERAAASDARYHRTMAAATYGLPPALMSAISGTTEEEANASAETLAAAFNSAVDEAATKRAGDLASAFSAGGVPGAPRGQMPVEAMRAGALPASAATPANPNDWIRAAFDRR